MDDKRILMITSNYSQNHMQINWGWHKYSKCWLNHQVIEEQVIVQNINNIKATITSKLKEKLLCDKEIEYTRNLRYYKEVIKPNLYIQKYVCILTSINNKINISKIRMNSHDLHSEIMHQTILATPCIETIYHMCCIKRVEYENNFQNVVCTPTLDLNFKIFITIQTILTF